MAEKAQKAHTSGPDCWCKPKVIRGIGGLAVEHRRDAAYEQRRPGTGRGRKAA